LERSAQKRTIHMTDETAAVTVNEPVRAIPRSAYGRTDKRSLSKELEEFAPLLKRFEQAVERARAASDRIGGSKPRATTSNKLEEAPTPNAPLLTLVRHWRDQLGKTADQLEAELQAIEESL
jgi:hypothetical protein